MVFCVFRPDGGHRQRISPCKARHGHRVLRRGDDVGRGSARGSGAFRGQPHGTSAPVVARADSVPGGADAAHATFRRRTAAAAAEAVVRVAVQVRGGGGRRPAAGRSDDGALARGHAVHVRQDHGPGRHTDRGDDAIHARPDQQAVDQVQDRRARAGRLRQGHVRLGNGHRLYQR